MSVFLLPDLGEGLAEAEIVSWHVGPGDHVTADQPLVSVETAKAVVEIPSPWAGTVARLLVAAGDMVPIGAPLIEFTEGASQPAAAIVGELSEAPPTPEKLSPAPPATSASAPTPKATPAVRRFAAERGVDLADLRRSGQHGEITRDDVLAGAAGIGSGGWEPLRGLRRTMAQVMARAGASVVPATVMDEVEVTDWPADAPVTLLLAGAMVAACRTEPALNARFDAEGLRRLLQSSVNLGIAVDTLAGLLVPVIHAAEAADLAAEIGRVVDLARSRKAPPGLYRDPTITLSNFGSLGGRHAVLVVMPPQVAILGAGRIFARGDPPLHRYLPLSLTFDHRAVTGGEAARFLAAVMVELRSATGKAREKP